MPDALTTAVSHALGTTVSSARPIAGGDINDTFAVTLADGRGVFVKSNARADARWFPCEARGLAWLAAADAVRLPRVLAVSDEVGPRPFFLVLERIEPAPRRADFDERLGRGLAALHAAGADAFGFHESNFIGSLPQANAPRDTWAAFYGSQRLEPQVRRAVDAGRAPAGWTRLFGRLIARLPDLAGPPEPPARLHGDLWGGNVLADERGEPCLIDPAVYGGHREMDLAMLRLFGGVGPKCVAAYHEAFPLAAGHEARVPLCQLYPRLVHVNLFGGGYVHDVESALRSYL